MNRFVWLVGAGLSLVAIACKPTLKLDDPGSANIAEHAPRVAVALPDAAEGALEPSGAEHEPPTGPSRGALAAARLEVDGLTLGDFAIVSTPSAEHSRGVVAVLGSSDAGDEYVVAIDMANARELTRARFGHHEPESSLEILRRPDGALIVEQQLAALQLSWIDSAGTIRSSRSLPELGTQASHSELRGVAILDDRIVLATDDLRPAGFDFVTMRIFDETGEPLAKHACRGHLFAPGEAWLERLGDQVVLINLMTEFGNGAVGRKPVCAGRLHGDPRWREARLAGAQPSLFAREGGVYFQDGDGIAKALDENLRATGGEPPPDGPVRGVACSGLEGGTSYRSVVVGGRRMTGMSSCCGGPGPNGVFVCDAPGVTDDPL